MSDEQLIEIEGWCDDVQVNAASGLTKVQPTFVTPSAEHLPLFIANLCKKWKVELSPKEDQGDESLS